MPIDRKLETFGASLFALGSVMVFLALTFTDWRLGVGFMGAMFMFCGWRVS